MTDKASVTRRTAKRPARAAPGGSFALRGGYVMTFDPGIGDIADGDVQVENGKITAVGKDSARPDVEVIDARGMIVMPGLVDTHTHMWR